MAEVDRYKRAVGVLIAGIAAAMSLWHMWVIWFSPPEAVIYRGTHLLFAMVLVFLIYPLRTKGEEALGAVEERGRPSILSWALIALTCAFILHLFVNYDYLVNRIAYIDDPTLRDTVLAVIGVALVFEATRRVVGLALPITALAFVAHAFLFTGISFDGWIDQMYLTTEGIFSNTLGVSAYYVVIFVLFGAFMERTGTGRLFMDFAMSLTGHTAGGPGKVSVISSSLFGTISGSAVANVMVDGPITIPLMKKTGFPPHFAAGVEATASTGGQIMPPVMGAAAFLMAEYLGVSYVQVTLWALIPSVLYYSAIFGAVHFEAKRRGLHGVPRAECPRFAAVMRERGHLFIPVFIILAMMYTGYSSPLAALMGSLACFPAAMLRKSTRDELRLVGVWEALVEGARQSLGVAMACACAGIIIGTIALTGIGITFTHWLVLLSQDWLLLALILTAVAGIVLGMGMPTTPAYVIMISLLVPAIINLGVMRPAAHMFAFYYAILSAITPPVALAVFAAAGIARTDLWKTGWAAVRIGAAGFIVPFMFVYDPAILMIGPWWNVVTASATAFCGCILLAASLHGYLVRATTRWESVVLFAAAICLVASSWMADIVGFGLAAAVIAWQYATRVRVQPA
jgi:TRAP transporter 4TM/12TM fusion protein